MLHFHPGSSSIQKGLPLAQEDAWSSGYQGILVAPFQGLAPWLNSQVWKVDTFLSWITTPLFRWKIRQGLGGLMAKMDKEADEYGARWIWQQLDQIITYLKPSTPLTLLQGCPGVWFRCRNPKGRDCSLSGRGEPTALRGADFSRTQDNCILKILRVWTIVVNCRCLPSSSVLCLGPTSNTHAVSSGDCNASASV